MAAAGGRAAFSGLVSRPPSSRGEDNIPQEIETTTTDDNAARADSSWNSLHRVGGTAALICAVMYFLVMGVYIPANSAGPPPGTIPEWFRLLQTNPLTGLFFLGREGKGEHSQTPHTVPEGIDRARDPADRERLVRALMHLGHTKPGWSRRAARPGWVEGDHMAPEVTETLDQGVGSAVARLLEAM